MGTYQGSSGPDVIDRSQGGTADIIVGNEGNDTLYGGTLADQIFGNLGNDVIVAGAGADTVYAGQGDDLVYGNQDNDLIYGNEGNDQVYAGVGNDLVDGGAGNDNLVGNEGNDTLLGGDGADLLYGNQNDDFLGGQVGNDTIYGGLGADTLIGGQGNDVMDGNEDNDVFYGNEGNDIITGGAGYDIAVFNGNYLDYAFGRDASGNLIVTDTRGDVAGNEGHDKIMRDVETVRFLGSSDDVNVSALADLQTSGTTRNTYAMGDSITEGYQNSPSTPADSQQAGGVDLANRWTSILDNLRSGTVYNAAISGGITGVSTNGNGRNMGDVWDNGSGSVPAGVVPRNIDAYVGGGHGGDVAIIMLGRNDISAQFNGGSYNQATTMANIDNMVQDARANGNHVLVSAVLLRSTEGSNNWGGSVYPNSLQGYNDVNSLNAALSAKYGDAFVDTNAAMMAANPSGDGVIADSFYSDTIHPNVNGDQQLGNYFAGELAARGW